MNIYIDESGSLNNRGNGFFSVALLFINDDNKKKIIRKFKKRNLEFKLHFDIDRGTELKGHFLKENNLMEPGKELLIKSINGCKAVISYQSNEEIQQWELRNKNAKFNQMVKCGIERGIDSGMITNGEKLRIHCDERNLTIKGLNSLEDYLTAYFIERKLDIEIVELVYVDSSNDYGVQMADLLSFYSFRWLFKKKPYLYDQTRISYRKIY